MNWRAFFVSVCAYIQCVQACQWYETQTLFGGCDTATAWAVGLGVLVIAGIVCCIVGCVRCCSRDDEPQDRVIVINAGSTVLRDAGESGVPEIVAKK